MRRAFITINALCIRVLLKKNVAADVGGRLLISERKVGATSVRPLQWCGGYRISGRSRAIVPTHWTWVAQLVTALGIAIAIVSFKPLSGNMGRATSQVLL